MATARERLSLIQRGLKAPKNKKNDFGGYMYRNASGILEAVKDLLEDGETITVDDELVLIGERYYNKATASFTSGDEVISASGYAREPETKKGMDESQITGAAGTYSKKYALGNLLALDDSKDDPDATNDHGKGSKSSQGSTSGGSNERSYPERAPVLPKEDRVPAELVDFLSPLMSVSDPALVDQAVDSLYRDHNRKAWGKGQEVAKVNAWLACRKAVINAEDEAEVRGAYKQMLEAMGYDAKANTADMPATHGQLVQWMVTVCSDRLMELKQAAA
jgi:hypothetical protein